MATSWDKNAWCQFLNNLLTVCKDKQNASTVQFIQGLLKGFSILERTIAMELKKKKKRKKEKKENHCIF